MSTSGYWPEQHWKVKGEQPAVNPVVTLVWGSFLQTAKLWAVLRWRAFVSTKLFLLYGLLLFLAADQTSHLLVTEFLSAYSSVDWGLWVTRDASISQQTAHESEVCWPDAGTGVILFQFTPAPIYLSWEFLSQTCLTNTEGSGGDFCSGGPGKKCFSCSVVYLHIGFHM